jgi:hypothetical protein
VVLVPRSESRHHDAGIGSLQRRTRASVSRTASAVSVGSFDAGTATTP